MKNKHVQRPLAAVPTRPVRLIGENDSPAQAEVEELNGKIYQYRMIPGRDFSSFSELTRQSLIGVQSASETSIPKAPKFILIKHEYKTIKIPIQDILYFQGKGNYVSVHTTDKVIVALLTMSKLEQALLSHGFIRSHKSFIVSFDKVDAVWNDKLEIQNKLIPIGSQYREKFLEFVNTHCLIINGGIPLAD